MAATLISDVFEPRLFAPYVVEQTAEKSALWQAGVVTQNPQLDQKAKEGGRLIDLPFWQDLSGNTEADDDSAAVTPAAITEDEQVARKHLARRAWSASDLATTVAGSDPLLAMADRFAAYWVRRLQTQFLIPSLTGLMFDTDSPLRAGATNPHVYDASIADGVNAAAANKFSTDNVIEATTGLLGDNYDQVGIVAMHSTVFATAQKLNLITFVDFGSQDVRRIPFFLGYRVIVDDSCRVVAGATSGFVYATYFLGAGSFLFGEGAPKVPAEVDRNSLVGSETVINRRHFFLHPNGVKWANAAVAGKTPTVSEMEDGTNWTLAHEHKNVAITALLSNG